MTTVCKGKQMRMNNRRLANIYFSNAALAWSHRYQKKNMRKFYIIWEELFRAGNSFLRRGIFSLLCHKWTEKDRSFSTPNPWPHVLAQPIYPQGLLAENINCSKALLNLFFFSSSMPFNGNVICIHLGNYSQGCSKAPDMGVCSCRHGKPTKVEGKVLS